MVSARAAVEGDLGRLAEVLTLAVEATTRARGASLYRQPARAIDPFNRVRAALDADDQLLIAGLVEDYVVGIALVKVDAPTPNASIGVIEELFVEEPARGVGVGEALVEAALAWCTEKGCSGVDMAALPGDRNAKNLCERAGFKARVLVMHRPL